MSRADGNFLRSITNKRSASENIEYEKLQKTSQASRMVGSLFYISIIISYLMTFHIKVTVTPLTSQHLSPVPNNYTLIRQLKAQSACTDHNVSWFGETSTR